MPDESPPVRQWIGGRLAAPCVVHDRAGARTGEDVYPAPLGARFFYQHVHDEQAEGTPGQESDPHTSLPAIGSTRLLILR